MLSQILHGLATAKSAALSMFENAFALTTQALQGETTLCPICGYSLTSGQPKHCWGEDCPVIVGEGSGTSSTSETPKNSSSPCEDPHLRNRYGIATPFASE